MRKKLLILLLVMFASIGTMFASTQIDGIWYLFSSNKATVTYQGSTYSSYPDEYSGDIVIPASVTHNNVTYSVTSIGNEAFRNCATLTSVTISNSVTSIGEEAFYGCSGLTSITIPNSVKIIGDYAFSGCSNASITIPNTVTNIGDNAFGGVPNIIYYGSLLGSPWGAKCINGFVDGYFVYTSASKTTLIACCTSVQGDIVIPNSVTRIGSSAFSGCSGLTSVTIPNSVTSIGSSAFRGCSGLTSVTIPNSVTSIGDEAFRSCSRLTSPIYNVHVFAYMPTSYSGAYTIPDGIESIAGNAFAGCSGLTSVTIPNSVTSIGYSAFSGCSGLTSVTIPNSVTSIGSNVFQVCTGLTSITIPNSVTSIGSNVFQGCTGLTSITIPNSVTSIGAYAFEYCSGLTSITIPNSVTSIGKNAFSGCSNINTIFYEGSIENWCTKKWSSQIIAPTYSLYLNGEEAQNVILPNTISSIPMNVFEGCINLTSVTIPNSVTSIGDYAFSGCSSLNSVSLSDSLFSIGRYAFSECINLLEVSIPHTIETIGSNAFDCVTRVVSNNENYRTYIRATPQGNLSGKGYLLVQASVNASYEEDNELRDEFGVRGYKFGRDGSHITISFPCNNTFKAGDVINIYTTKNSDIGNSMYLYSDSQGQELLAIIPHNENAGLHSITLGEEVEGLNTISLYRKKNSTYDMNPYVAYMEVVRTKSFHYNIECNNEEGAVSSSGVAEYMEKLEISAMPNDHYHFTQWSDGNTDNPRTITLTQDTTITAEFEKNTYTISTVSSNPEWGSTSGDTSAFYLDTVIIVATPNTGYQFTQWSDGNTNNPRTIVLIQDTMYAAEFANSTCILNSGTCGSNITWTISCDSILTISGTGAMNDYSGTSAPWFSYYSSITSVIVENGVTSIGNFAFYKYYSALTSVTIPNSVTSIGNSAFSYCSSLTSVTIPNSVTSIGGSAFCNCSSLTSMTIPNSVTSIEDDAFRDCTGLTSIEIPNSVTSIGNQTFYHCSGLTSIEIPNSVTSIGYMAFNGCSGLTSVTIPNSVTSIGGYAFSGCTGLTSIEIPNSVTSIGELAFSGCTGLTSIEIPNSVTSIGDRAFSYCSSLTSVTIPNSVTSIGGYAFSGCSGLTSMKAPAGFFDVPEDSWPYYTKILNHVTVNGGELTENALLFINRYKTLRTMDVSGATNTEFVDEAFKGYYNLTELKLPADLQKVSYMMVAGCKNLQSIDIPASVEEIEQSAFEDCRSIKTITFGENPSLIRIGNWAFYNCHELQNLEIPEGVTEIGDGAFYGCTYLKNLNLPASVQSIGDNGFAFCSKLQKMVVHAVTPPDIDYKTFEEVSRQTPVYVPDESVDEYENHPLWKEFFIQGISNMPTGIDEISSSLQGGDRGRLIYHEGQIYILRGEKVYTLQGQEVR